MSVLFLCNTLVETNSWEMKKKIASRFLHLLVVFLDDNEERAIGHTEWFLPTSQKNNRFLPAPTAIWMTGQLPTILISDGADRVMPSEGRKNSLCPFLGENPFFDFLPSACLQSSLNVSQPGRESGMEKRGGRGGLRSAGRKPLKTYTIKFFLLFSLMSY